MGGSEALAYSDMIAAHLGGQTRAKAGGRVGRTRQRVKCPRAELEGSNGPLSLYRATVGIPGGVALATASLGTFVAEA